jgi:hypothetical protein
LINKTHACPSPNGPLTWLATLAGKTSLPQEEVNFAIRQFVTVITRLAAFVILNWQNPRTQKWNIRLTIKAGTRLLE